MTHRAPEPPRGLVFAGLVLALIVAGLVIAVVILGQ